MPHNERQEGFRRRDVSDSEEKWSRRAATLVGLVGLGVAGWLLGIGFADQSREVASASAVPCAALVERCFVPLMANAHTHPALWPLAIPESRKQELMERFKRAPLHRKLFRDTERWFEEDRQLIEVDDNWGERQKVTQFLVSQLLEIDDARFIADLEKTPQGRLFLETMARGEISYDRTTMVVSYAKIITHYDCFMELDLNKIKEIQRENNVIELESN